MPKLVLVVASWNILDHKILQAIDNHTRLFLETGDFWHQEQADILRKYIKDLKVWIHKEEGWWNE